MSVTRRILRQSKLSTFAFIAIIKLILRVYEVLWNRGFYIAKFIPAKLQEGALGLDGKY